jgi:hypothetical protein
LPWHVGCYPRFRVARKVRFLRTVSLMKAIYLAIGFALLSVAAVKTAETVGANTVKTHLISALKRSCPACSLEIGELRFSLFNKRVLATDIHYSGDPKQDSTLRFSAERIEIRVDPFSLLRREPHIESIDAIQPDVIVREKSNTPPGEHPAFPSPGAAFKDFPMAQVDHVRIYGGKFVYEIESHGQVGKLRISEIDGNVSRFATRQGLLSERYRLPVLMVATAKLESSGSVKFRVLFDPFAEKNRDSIELDVRGQKMQELNPFFSVESGLTFEGFLKKGNARLTVAEGHLSGTLEGSYEGLKLDFHPTPERGKLSSTLTTAISSLKTAKTRPKSEQNQAPQADISAQREPHEPITKFLIRGLRDAAKKVLTS